jgi:hypothetical protein
MLSMSLNALLCFVLGEVVSSRGSNRNTLMLKFELGHSFTLSMCFVESDETQRHKELDRRPRDDSLYVGDSLSVPE